MSEQFVLRSQVVGVASQDKSVKPVRDDNFEGIFGRGFRLEGNVGVVYRLKDGETLKNIPLNDIPVGYSREIWLTPFFQSLFEMKTEAIHVSRIK